MNVKPWLAAARLRTLPLAFSSIFMGSAVAMTFQSFSWLIFVLALLTTTALQILSNFANDYGDAVSGKDNEGRIGPERAVASGSISKESMKIAVVITAIIAFLLGAVLIAVSFQNSWLYLLVFLVLGLLSIAAAINYTMGKNPYGYRALGDVFVFLFFGWLGVMGSFFLFTQKFEWLVLLPASAIGFLSVAVLNFNNMRDIENDAKTGKRTLAVVLGLQNAKMYQYLIIIAAFFCLIAYAFWQQFPLQRYAFLLVAPFFAQMIKAMIRINTPALFDPFLKKTALGTFLLSLIFLITQLVNYAAG
jgi:1,4-dihydroxy-2-naphthoate octaprenyltransferase